MAESEALPQEVPSVPVAEPSRPPTGEPLLVPLSALCEDPDNPCTEFPPAERQELAEDIRQHGILQPIVVLPADAGGRYRIHFGAKRFRAAGLAGLERVPVTLRPSAADSYAQVAENQKRHGLTPQDLARFIRGRVDLGESNATIAKRLGMDLTTVAHQQSCQGEWLAGLAVQCEGETARGIGPGLVENGAIDADGEGC